MEISKEIKQKAEEVYNVLQPYCIAIYLGGSYCQEYIRHKHDVDFICFADKPVNMCHIRRLLYLYFKKHPVPENYDFIQVRNIVNEEHAYGSYINREMIKLVGRDINFTFNVLGENRSEYFDILRETIIKLNNGKIKNW